VTRALLLVAICAVGGSARADELPEASTHRLHLALGFSHWFGPTLGSPDGFTTPAVAVGVRPGVAFLELVARYTVSLESHIGFASLEVLATREMHLGNQALVAHVGPLGLVSHGGEPSPAAGYGVAFGLEYLFATGLGAGNALGIFLGTRVVYGFGDGRRDAQIDLGVIATIF
jgi:hypothetical protein